MNTIRQQIMKACEDHGFHFQEVYSVALEVVVLRRRRGCNQVQIKFWMSVADEAQQSEAFTDAMTVISLEKETLA